MADIKSARDKNLSLVFRFECKARLVSTDINLVFRSNFLKNCLPAVTIRSKGAGKTLTIISRPDLIKNG